MMRRLFFNLTCNCFQYKLFVVRAEIRTCRALAGAATADVDLEGRVRTV